MFATGQVNLSEAWRWQHGTALGDAIDGGVASGSPDGNSLFVAGAVPRAVLQPQAAGGFSEETSALLGGGNSSTAARLAVFKLDGSTGEQLWVFEDSADAVGEAVAIGVDRSGDVIVGGTTTTTSAIPSGGGSWQQDMPNISEIRNCAAFKLDGDTGKQLWSYQTAYQGDENFMSASSTSNTSVSSSSSSGYYTSTSAILSLSVDSAGNALFVGQTRGDSAVVLENGANHTHAINAINNTINSTIINNTIGKLDGTTGELLWSVQGGATGPLGMLSACETDSQDNLVAAGVTEGGAAAPSAGGGDFFVVKLDGDGEEIWAWQDGTERDETLLAVAIDAEDNIYVAGGEGTPEDPSIRGANASIVLKLDGSTGQELWRYSGEPGASSSSSSAQQHPMGSLFRGLAVDNTTGIIVAAGMAEGAWASGQTAGSSSLGGYDFAAVALNSTSGEELGRWQAGTAQQDELYFAAFDSAGGLYLGGYSEGASWASSSSSSSGNSSGNFGEEGTVSDIAVVKFEPSSSQDYLGILATTSTSSTSSDDGDDLETWQLVVGIVALTAALLLLFCMACLIRRSRRNKALNRSVEDLSGAIVRCAPASDAPLSNTEMSSSPHVLRAEISPSPVPRRKLSRGYLGSWKSAKGDPGKHRSRRSLWVSRILRVGAPDTPLRSGTKNAPKAAAAPRHPNHLAMSPIAGNKKTETPSQPAPEPAPAPAPASEPEPETETEPEPEPERSVEDGLGQGEDYDALTPGSATLASSYDSRHLPGGVLHVPESTLGGGADQDMEEPPLTPEWRIPPPPSYPSPFPPVRRGDSDLPDEDLTLEPGLASYDSASESVAVGSRVYTDVEAGLGLFNESEGGSDSDRSLRRDSVTRVIDDDDTFPADSNSVISAVQGPGGSDTDDNLVFNGRGRSSPSSVFPMGVEANRWGPPIVFGGREDSAAASSSAFSGSDASLRSNPFIGIGGRADSAAASVFPGYDGYESPSPRVGLGEREDSAAGSTFHEPASRYWGDESRKGGFAADAGGLPRYPRGAPSDSASDLSVGWGEISAGGVRGRVSISESSSGQSDARGSEERSRRAGRVQASPFPRRKPSRRIPDT